MKKKEVKLQVLSWSTWTNSSTTCSETKDIATFSCLDCRYCLLKTKKKDFVKVVFFQKREALEEVGELQLYKSILDDDLDAMSASSDSDDDKDKKKERPRLTKRRSRSRSKEREHRKERERERERSRRERERAEGGGGRDKDKERDRESRRDDRGDKERHKGLNL